MALFLEMNWKINVKLLLLLLLFALRNNSEYMIMEGFVIT